MFLKQMKYRNTTVVTCNCDTSRRFVILTNKQNACLHIEFSLFFFCKRFMSKVKHCNIDKKNTKKFQFNGTAEQGNSFAMAAVFSARCN